MTTWITKEEEENIEEIVGVPYTEQTITHIIKIVPTAAGRLDFLTRLRDARLAEVDQLERAAGISPRTAEIRRAWKEGDICV